MSAKHYRGTASTRLLLDVLDASSEKEHPKLAATALQRATGFSEFACRAIIARLLVLRDDHEYADRDILHRLNPPTRPGDE